MTEFFTFDDSDTEEEAAEEENNQPDGGKPEFFLFEHDSGADEMAQEMLANAARTGNVGEVKYFLRARGRQPLGTFGDVPLAQAVHGGHVTAVAMLLLGMADPCREALACDGMAPTAPSTLLVRLAAKAELENTANCQRIVFCALDMCTRFLVAEFLRTLGVNIAVQNVLSDAQWSRACEAEADSRAAQADSRAAQAGRIPRSENGDASSASTVSSEVVEPAPSMPSESLPQAGPMDSKPHDDGSREDKLPDGCYTPPGIECWYESVPGSDCIEVRDAASEEAPVVSSLPVPFESSVRLYGVECNVNGGVWLYLSSRSQEMLGFSGTPLWSLINRGPGAPVLLQLPVTIDVGATRRERSSSEIPVPDNTATPSSSSTSGEKRRENPCLFEMTADAEVGRRERAMSDDSVPTTTATPRSSTTTSGGQHRVNSSLSDVTADVDSATKETWSSDNPMPSTISTPSSSSPKSGQSRENLSSSEVTVDADAARKILPRDNPEATTTATPSSGSDSTNNEQPRDFPSLSEVTANAEAPSREGSSVGDPVPTTMSTSSSTEGGHPRENASSSGVTADVKADRRETSSSDNPSPITTETLSSSSTKGGQPGENQTLFEATADVGTARRDTSSSDNPVTTTTGTPSSSTSAQPRVNPSLEVKADVEAARRETSSSDNPVQTNTAAPSSSSTSGGRPKGLSEAVAALKSQMHPAEAPAEKLCGAMATYEVIHEPRVGIRALPSLESELLASLPKGYRVFGCPYEVNDLPWLKLSQQTMRTLAVKQHTAWILIDRRSPELGMLLRKLEGGIAESGPPPKSSARAMPSSGAKHMPKAPGAAPAASPMPFWKPSLNDGRTDVKPLDADGRYKVLQHRSAVRNGPTIDANILSVAKQGNVMSGTPYFICGTPWLRLDTNSCEKLGVDEDCDGGAWVLIDGSKLGFGRLLERLVENPLQKDREEDLTLDTTQEEVRKRQQWYALEVAKPENSHLPAEKIEAYTKQLNEALRNNNGMTAKTLLQNRGALCRTHAAFDLAAEDLQMAAKLHPRDAIVRFECGVARLEARRDGDAEAAAKALGDFRAAQMNKLDPKYASAAALEKWIQRAKHWSMKPELPNHYLALGVQIEATSEQLKKGHRQSALRWHPDKPGGDGNRFREMQLAWEVLKCPDKRHEYDFGVVPSPARGKAGTKSRGTARR